MEMLNKIMKPALAAGLLAALGLLGGCSSSSTQTAATPTFTPAAGTYSSSQTVTVADTTVGVILYCTVDGSTPTTASPQCTEPITVATTETLKAIAVPASGTASAVASASYTITPAASAPVFSPAGGVYTSAQTVTITDASSSAAIFYTTDGSSPITSSTRTQYTAPITIAATTTLNAIAALNGGNSAVATATYTINISTPSAPATPVITPAAGTYSAAQTVTITDATAGAVIYYTIDGTTPTSSSTQYSAPFMVSATTTVNAIAILNGISSTAATAAYTISTGGGGGGNEPPPTIAGSAQSATYPGTINVTLADTDANGVIYYTVGYNNTTTPNPNATTTPPTVNYGVSSNGSPFTVSSTQTVVALAVNGASNSSTTVMQTFTVAEATPTISPAAGAIAPNTPVTLTDADPGATIYYTTDGSTPTTSSTQYSAPFNASGGETINAIAIDAGNNATQAYYTQSLTATAAYTAITGTTLTGTVSSGTTAKAISGASVQVYAAGTGAYGVGAAKLLTTAATTGSTGKFSATFTCPAAPGDQIYLVATGGKYGSSTTANPDIALMTALGSCASIPTSVTINEVTTIASAYALEGFSSVDPSGGIDIGAPTGGATSCASGGVYTLGNSQCNYPGLVNAFNTVGNLIKTSTGAALTTTPAYAAHPVAYLNASTVPQTRINTLANLLATCVEQATGCTTLFTDAKPTGGVAPTDTLQTALDIAQHPGNNVTTLFALQAATPPYTPALPTSAAPTDFTIALTFTGAGLGNPSTVDSSSTAINNQSLALDSSGNVWVVGYPENPSPTDSLLAGFSNLGAPLTPATTATASKVTYGGFGPAYNTGAGLLNEPKQIIIDPSQNLWIPNTPAGSIEGGVEIGSQISHGALTLTPIQTDQTWLTDSNAPYVIDATTAGNFWDYQGASGAQPPTYVLGATDPATGLAAATLALPYPVQNIIFDSKGALWTVDISNGLNPNAVLLNSSSGAQLAIFPSERISNSDLVAGANGDIYGCNTGQDEYFVFSYPNSTATESNLDNLPCGAELAVDGAGNIWSYSNLLNQNNDEVSVLNEVSSAGSLLSPASVGFTGTTAAESPSILANPATLAIDGSGNFWVLNSSTGDSSNPGNALVEFVGLAAPTVSPLSVAVQNGAQGTKP